jgi:hypothetical protein
MRRAITTATAVRPRIYFHHLENTVSRSGIRLMIVFG